MVLGSFQKAHEGSNISFFLFFQFGETVVKCGHAQCCSFFIGLIFCVSDHISSSIFLFLFSKLNAQMQCLAQFLSTPSHHSTRKPQYLFPLFVWHVLLVFSTIITVNNLDFFDVRHKRAWHKTELCPCPPCGATYWQCVHSNNLGIDCDGTFLNFLSLTSWIML